MPNWCENELSIIASSPEELEAIKEKLYKDEAFSFQALIPRPKSLDITSGGNVDKEIAYIKATEENEYDQIDKYIEWPAWVKSTDIEEQDSLDIKREKMLKYIKESLEMSKNSVFLEEGRKALENIKLYGCKDWYDWNIRNYGTKWDVGEVNCQNDDDTSVEISFDTAWSPPEAWFKKLMETFPDTEMELKFAEPGAGYMGYISNEGQSSEDYEEVCQECGTIAKYVENEDQDGMYCSHCEAYDVDTEAAIFRD